MTNDSTPPPPTLRIREILSSGTDGDRCVVQGWVRTRRDSKGGFSFIEVNDGSALANLQVIADKELKNYETDIAHLHPGSAVRITGTLTASPGAKQSIEMHAQHVEVMGTCEPTLYPLQKQRIAFEKLREFSHLRPRTNTFGAISRIRNALSIATHTFFQERGFLFLHTPIITTSDCEGAGEQFRVTTLDPDTAPKGDDGRTDLGADFFGEATALTVSGQLEAECYACALGSVYTFGPTFRAENSNTPRHLAEFWMIEPEMAFADLDDDVALAEEYLTYMFKHVLSACPDDMAFFDKRIEPGLLDSLSKIIESTFARVTYTEAIEILEKADRTFEFPVSWGCDLQTEHERYLTEDIFETPVIVTDYPKDIKPFYMRINDDGRTVAAMDVLLPKIGEIIGGSQREERLELLTERIRESGLDEETYQWYIDLRRFGTVPHAGFGLGFERLVQFATGMKNIRDVIPFPRTPRNAKF